ncbi:hypothetical protein B6S44_12110 [Bosea sp. Tri-44]|uniref:DUF924 family protein n=1 Tax=Bosea sp. Tri-44 TaxID=1972137 RepID=UPI00100F23F6|nr:DUF924 family protein [Bosea sp. Tri-44]RXT55026.1 hypothetical protein B6S44_12110 [Bosea sp. Tri-44]
MTQPIPPAAAEVLAFWREAGPDKWFAKDDAFDTEIARRFRPLVDTAARGELSDWEETPEGVYALLILLDQFPRNLHRGSAHAFAADALAREVAGRAIARGFDEAFHNPERRFLYMPFMHSEALADQERCVDLTKASGDDDSTKYAVIHRDIIRDFGRFPHRNAVLGRQSSTEEQRFLEDGGFNG